MLSSATDSASLCTLIFNTAVCRHLPVSSNCRTGIHVCNIYHEVVRSTSVVHGKMHNYKYFSLLHFECIHFYVQIWVSAYCLNVGTSILDRGNMIAFLHRCTHLITFVYYSFRGVHCLNNWTMVIHVWLLVAIVLWTSDWRTWFVLLFTVWEGKKARAWRYQPAVKYCNCSAQLYVVELASLDHWICHDTLLKWPEAKPWPRKTLNCD